MRVPGLGWAVHGAAFSGEPADQIQRTNPMKSVHQCAVADGGARARVRV